MITNRIVLKLAALNNWNLYQMDVCNAFLQGDLHEEVYMSLPPGFEVKGEQLVCRLKKSIYGLKQASRQWNEKFTTALIKRGFRQSKHDYSLFISKQHDGIVLVLIYVDDLIITGSSESGIEDTKQILHDNFKIKDLGSMKYFLGIEIARSTKGIALSQRKYILDLLAETGMSGCKPLSMPMSQTLKLLPYREGKDKKNILLGKPERYRRLIGKLLYLTMTRPDIAFPVQNLAQFMKTPTKDHMAAARNVVRYLKGTPGLGVLISSTGSNLMECFCDSDWASCAVTRRSVTGYILKFGGSTVMWKSKKQGVVSKSSAEAEYRALSMAVSEIIWALGLLKDLEINHSDPVEVHCDNKAAIHIASNPVYHERTKHIEVDCHFVREKVQSGLIKLSHIRSTQQEADLLTKATGAEVLKKLLFKLGIVDFFNSQFEGECRNK